MTLASLSVHLWREGVTFVQVMRGFHPNAKRYLLMLLLVGLGLEQYNLLYNLYLLQLGYNEVLVGQVVALYSLGAMLGSLPGGILYYHWGGRSTFACAVLFMAGVRLAQVWVTTPGLLLLAAAGAGAAHSSVGQWLRCWAISWGACCRVSWVRC